MKKEILLPCGKIAVIDAELFDAQLTTGFRDGSSWTGRVCDIGWYSTKTPGKLTQYAHKLIVISGKNKNLFLHRVVMQAETGIFVDHRDGNGLNCVGTNLRLANHVQNGGNRGPAKDRRFKGTFYFKGKWQSHIRIMGKKIHLGMFATEEAAAEAYDRAALEHFGEFACVNFPGGAA